MSNVDRTRPITVHQYLFRFDKSGIYGRQSVQSRERLAEKIRKYTMWALKS